MLSKEGLDQIRKDLSLVIKLKTTDQHIDEDIAVGDALDSLETNLTDIFYSEN